MALRLLVVAISSAGSAEGNGVLRRYDGIFGMQALFTSLIAVSGTLLGSTTSFLFQRRSADRAEGSARAERLRLERLTAYSAYAGAITELKRGIVSLWFRRQEDPGGAEYRMARAECDRLGAAAEQAQFRMRLISEDPDLAMLADAAFAATGSIGHAADKGQLSEREAYCLDTLNAFIAGAAAQLRSPASPGTTVPPAGA